MKKNVLIHNPACSKSRAAKDILEKNEITFETYLYLEAGLTEEFLEFIKKSLQLNYQQMIRQNTATEMGIEAASEEEWKKILNQHPKLLERPIFIKGDLGIIARPPEGILEFLAQK